MNDTIHTILTRRTAHVFESRPIPEELLTTALECAIRAPNHKLSNPWRFTRVGPVARATLVELAVRLKEEKGALSEAQREKVRAKVGSSPELIVVRQLLSPDPVRRREDFAACACAIENLAIALWSEGVSSKWSTGAPTSHDETYALLGIDRGREQIIGFVWIGYADEQPRTRRHALEDVLTNVD